MKDVTEHLVTFRALSLLFYNFRFKEDIEPLLTSHPIHSIDIIIAAFSAKGSDRIKKENDARDEYNRLIIAFKNTKGAI